MSGGGHRACVFALGVLMYLADADRTSQITSAASVSGGSLANGAVGQDLDLATCSAADMEATVGRVARCVTGRGTLFGAWITIAYLTALIIIGLLVLIGTWLLPVEREFRLILFAAGVLLLAWLAGLRGRLAASAFGSTLYTREGSRTKVADLHDNVDHVICATDLHAGEHVYFSGRFVCSYRFGFGSPGTLRLEAAVQASAAFPGAFPVRRLGVSRFRFRDPLPEASGTRTLVLHDGGVYDNMADQWAHGLKARAPRWAHLGANFRDADELIVVSASAGLAWVGLGTLRLPLVGAFLALLRDKSVLYDNGNSVRRRELVARFDLAEREGSGLRGALVHIPQSPYEVPDAFAAAENLWPERGSRAGAALETLGSGSLDREAWAAVAAQNARVPTTLVGLKKDVTARLLHHAYVLAMVNLHVILGYPLLELPDPERFGALLRE
jgi:hypothetical protein